MYYLGAYRTLSLLLSHLVPTTTQELGIWILILKLRKLRLREVIIQLISDRIQTQSCLNSPETALSDSLGLPFLLVSWQGWMARSLGRGMDQIVSSFLSRAGSVLNMRIQRGMRHSLYLRKPNVSLSASQTFAPKYSQWLNILHTARRSYRSQCS